MHGKSPDTDAAWLAVCGQAATDRSGLVPCACGCGALLGKSKWGRQYKFSKGHRPRRDRADWARIYNKLLQQRVPCACGCGENVPLAYGKSLEQFMLHRGDQKRQRYILGHRCRPTEYANRLTVSERQAVLGTLLGDAHIGYPNSRSRNPRLSTNHGGPQEAWARYKAEKLRRLGIHVDLRPNGGFGTTTVRCVSRCLPALRAIHTLVHPSDATKRITRAWLDQIGLEGLAWWICDDGSTSDTTGTMRLHTEGYDRESVLCAQAWFVEKYGPVSLAAGRTCGWSLYLSRECRDAIRGVGKYIPECMAYKLQAFAADRKAGPRRRRV